MAKTLPRDPAAVRDAGLLSREYGFRPSHVAWLQAAVIALVTLWIYSPSISGDWLWDDSVYLTQNPLLNQPGRLWKAWFQPGSFIEYYPIEQTLQWLQWQLWGTDTFRYHVTNIALHIANALLLWRLLARLGVQLAWIGGLIFAAHPMNVESVAWVSEFKNCLSLAPALLTLTAWIDYDASRRGRDYGICLALFVVAMLCKITLAMFPFVILLHAWWKRGRIGRDDLLAAAPFFLISLVLGLVAISSDAIYHRSIHEIPALVVVGGPLSRLALVGTSAAFYFAASFLPLVLLPVYPMWQVDPPTFIAILPWLGFGVAFAWLWSKRAGWGRHALFGAGFFFINLAPFLGLHDISYMTFTWVMDHFLYLPAIGLIGLAAAAISDLDHRIALINQAISTALITLLIAALAFRAHWYAAAFTNEETLWTYTLEGNPTAWPALNNMGKIYIDEGEPQKALEYLSVAVVEQPGNPAVAANYGNALARAGRTQEGIAQLQRALQISPYNADANNNLGVALAQEGKLDDAMAHFKTAIEAKPDEAEAYCNMGTAYVGLNKWDEATRWFGQALKLRPDYPEALCNLGNVKLEQGKSGEAIGLLEHALQLRPDYLEAHLNLGLAMKAQGQTTEAIEQFQIALQLDPNNAVARDNLAALRPAPPGPAK